ncbi:chemotaxis protein CheW [Roseicella aquatilis]|uniref:Chemotaxis protein CheW n=2 Tax=Roseicella aquatilis TaxID=2527868 RepID=A0A4R4DDQ3_9PROT|nr:chemotaxis protein CheW [Roseicella aquatilis]
MQSPQRAAAAEAAEHLLLTLTIAGRLCGIPVPRVRDVLANQAIARIPLAPPEVAGALNLRGRIVTALDLRHCLGLPPAEAGVTRMSVVVEQEGELYSLLADSVREVLNVPVEAREELPETLRGTWREHAVAVHRLQDELLIELDTDRLLAVGSRGTGEWRR